MFNSRKLLLREEEVVLVNHVADLDRKIGSSQFNLQQLNIGRGACMNMLTESLKVEEVEDAQVE